MADKDADKHGADRDEAGKDEAGKKRVDRYLVKTDYGDVLVRINTASRNALENDLLSFERPTPDNTRGVAFEVPIRAFGAKMLEIIEGIGVGDLGASPKMVEMMIREKATSDLSRIERWAREHARDERA